jgi:Kef-type K+ transport system membrane component KefB
MIHHLPIIIGMLVAIVSPIVSYYVKIPLVLVEFIIGILFGTILEKDILNKSEAAFISYIGFLILMFLAGFEVDFDFMEEFKPRELIFVFLYVFMLIPFSFLSALSLGLEHSYVVIAPLISVGLGLPILKESNIIKTDLGQKLLILGSVGEVSSIFYISFMNALLKFGVAQAIVKTIITYVVLILAIMFAKALKNKLKEYRVVVRNISLENTHIFIRLALFTTFISASLFEIIGMEPILGSMLSGMVLGYVIRKKEVINKSFYDMAFGFFVPLFFVYTGFSLNIAYISKNILMSGVEIGIVLFVARFGISFILLLAGFRLVELPFVSLFISFPFTLLIASIKILSDIKYITPAQGVAILIGTVFSSLIYPIMFKVFARFYVKDENI